MASFVDTILDVMSIKPANARVSPFAEAGVSGTAVFGGYVQIKERSPDLWGQRRYIKASEMLTNTSIIAAGVRFYLNLLAKPKWVCEPPNDKAETKAVAEFFEEVITGMDTGWARIVRRGGMFSYHGFGIQEWQAMKRTDGKIGLKNIEVRPQHTIERWSLDPSGGVEGVWQRSPQTGTQFWIPRNKMVYLVDDMMTDSPEGLGWFRALVEPSNRMKKYLDIEALGFERDLSGIPVGRAPIGEMNRLVGTAKPGGGVWTAGDVQAMVKGLREFVTIEARAKNTGILLDSSAYVDKKQDGPSTSSVLKWGVDLLTGKADSIQYMGAAIERLTFEMARIMGIENMLTGSNGVGSNALSQDKSQNLYLMVNSCLGDMAEGYTRDVIDPIAAMNGIPDEDKPKLKCEDVAFKDVQQIAATLRDMATAGAVLDPEDEAIDDVRDLLGIAHAKKPTPEERAARMGMGNMPDANGEGDPSTDPQDQLEEAAA